MVYNDLECSMAIDVSGRSIDLDDVTTKKGALESLDKIDDFCLECPVGNDETCEKCPLRNIVDYLEEVVRW